MRAIAAVALIAIQPAVGAEGSALSQTTAVWAQERAYWDATIGRDDATFQSLWHPAFVGWPCDEVRPVSGLPPHMVRDRVKRSYVMNMQATTQRPGLVSTFYHVRERDVLPSGKIKVFDYNVTHVWVPSASGWKIISGMCKHPDALR